MYFKYVHVLETVEPCFANDTHENFCFYIILPTACEWPFSLSDILQNETSDLVHTQSLEHS